jgi:hypothetical protein
MTSRESRQGIENLGLKERRLFVTEHKSVFLSPGSAVVSAELTLYPKRLM